MTYSVSNHSSIFQPLVDLPKWCKTETVNLVKCSLPPKDKWADILRRIIIVCSVIIPLIGLLTIVFSAVYDDLIGDFKKSNAAGPAPHLPPPPVRRLPEVHRPPPPVPLIAPPLSTDVVAAQT
jgi:hypothetical protein